MSRHTDLLYSTSFKLALPGQEISSLYPNLAESWYQKYNSFQKKDIRKEQYIKFDYILLYKNYPQQAITYKIVKLQRILTILSKLSKKLSFFQKIEEILRIQNTKAACKKGSHSQSIIDEQLEIQNQYKQKGENLLEKIVKQYNMVIALLKLSNNKSRKLFLKDYIIKFLILKKKELNVKVDGQSPDFQNLSLKQQFIRKMQQINSKLYIKLSKVFNQMGEISKKNQTIHDFLIGSHKYFKMQSCEMNNLNSIHFEKGISNYSQLNKINSNIFQVLLKFKLKCKSANQKKFIFNQNTSQQQYQLVFNWNLIDIQQICISLQNLYNFIYDEPASVKEKFTNPLKYQQKIDQVIKKFQKDGLRNIFNSSQQIIRLIFNFQDQKEIYNHFGIPAIQLLQKNKQSTKFQNLFYNDIQINSFSDTSSFFSQKVEEQNVKEGTQKINSFLALQENIVSLSIAQSREFLCDFYRHLAATIYCYIECQKQWFFKSPTFPDNNTTQHLFTYVKWIPLKKQLSCQNNNSFTNYIISVVQNLMEPKHNSQSFVKKTQVQSQNYFKEMETSNIQESSEPYFIYNEPYNILAYQNLSFQNINHCHYYLKHIKNDTRSEFEDRSWIEYLNQQSIRLFINRNIQSKKKPKNEQLHSQMINIVRIPVRGRYCRHIDFFDLSEVYSLIYPEPFCEPKDIICPKCWVQISFDELIYLKQVQILLELIRIFYLENSHLTKYLPKKNDENKFKNFKQQKPVNRIEQQKFQFILKDLKLIVNHQIQTIKIKGKYNYKTFPQIQACSFETSSSIQKSMNNEEIINFQQQLDKIVYQTLVNPNKNFKTEQKLNNVLNNFGLSKIIIKQNQKNRKMQSQANQSISFDQKIQISKNSINNHWKLYTDLEKGTIAI